MSPRNSALLINEVYPRLRNAVRSIPKIGHEDDEEVVQDTMLMAARMLDAAEKAGKSITAGNASFFAIKAARTGRRSFYSGRSDVLHPGSQLDGRARHQWMDDEIELETGEFGSLHDIIAPNEYQGHETDPAEEAGRNLDWEAFLAARSPRHRIAICALLDGHTMREAGKRCGLRDSAALLLKRKIAEDLVEFFGAEVIQELLGGVRPSWDSDLRLARERGHRPEGTFRPQAQSIG